MYEGSFFIITRLCRVMPNSDPRNRFVHPHDHYLTLMSLVMRKSDFCICENKDADQLRGNQVETPEDRFSQNEALMINSFLHTFLCQHLN